MPAEGDEFFGAGHIPHLHRSVSASRGNASPIGTEGYCEHNIAVSLELEQFFAGGHFPELNCSIIIWLDMTGNQAGTIATESHALNPLTLKSAEFLAARRVQQSDQFIVTDQSQNRPIATEGQRSYPLVRYTLRPPLRLAS